VPQPDAGGVVEPPEPDQLPACRMWREVWTASTAHMRQQIARTTTRARRRRRLQIDHEPVERLVQALGAGCVTGPSRRPDGRR